MELGTLKTDLETYWIYIVLTLPHFPHPAKKKPRTPKGIREAASFS